MKTDTCELFGTAFLKPMREERGLTLRELEKLSGVHNANIAAIETGNKTVGCVIAQKLASGLKLKGDKREVFVDAAIRTIQPTIADVVREALGGEKVQERDILRVSRGLPMPGDSNAPDFVVTLRDGRVFGFDVKATGRIK